MAIDDGLEAFFGFKCGVGAAVPALILEAEYGLDAGSGRASALRE